MHSFNCCQVAPLKSTAHINISSRKTSIRSHCNTNSWFCWVYSRNICLADCCTFILFCAAVNPHYVVLHCCIVPWQLSFGGWNVTSFHSLTSDNFFNRHFFKDEMLNIVHTVHRMNLTWLITEICFEVPCIPWSCL